MFILTILSLFRVNIYVNLCLLHKFDISLLLHLCLVLHMPILPPPFLVISWILKLNRSVQLLVVKCNFVFLMFFYFLIRRYFTYPSFNLITDHVTILTNDPFNCFGAGNPGQSFTPNVILVAAGEVCSWNLLLPFITSIMVFIFLFLIYIFHWLLFS